MHLAKILIGDVMTTFKRNFSFLDKDDIKKNISKNIRKYREEAGITQEQLAIDIGISPDYLRRFETNNGKEGLSIHSLYKISVVLDIPVDKFLE